MYSYSKNSYRWFKSVSRHQTQSVHVISGCSIFSHHEADSGWNIWHISFICNSVSSAWSNVHLWSPCAVSNSKSDVFTHTQEKIPLLAHESKKKKTPHFVILTVENGDSPIKKKVYQWINSWEDLKYNRLVLGWGLQDHGHRSLQIGTDSSYASTVSAKDSFLNQGEEKTQHCLHLEENPSAFSTGSL